MAIQTKVHPATTTSNFQEIGKVITWFNVTTTGVNVSASTAPYGAIESIYLAIEEIGTIIAAGAFTNATPSVCSFGVEGEFDVALFQTAIQALGIVDTLDLSTSTVVAKTLALA